MQNCRTKLCPWTDGQTAMAIPAYPLHFVVGGIIIMMMICKDQVLNKGFIYVIFNSFPNDKF